MKASTKGFIGMLDTNWVTDLLNHPTWADSIYYILAAFFLLYKPQDNFSIQDKNSLRNYITENLIKLQSDIGNRN